MELSHEDGDIEFILRALEAGSLPGLRHCARRGLPDGCGLRPIVWQAMLGSMPLEQELRSINSAAQMQAYRGFVEDFVDDVENIPIQQNLHDRIEKDVRRTLRSHHMFASNTMVSAALNRVLFIYASLHPRVGYIQGLNELVAPIFWVLFADNKNLQDRECSITIEQAEVETFFSFSKLMARIRDCYTEDLDSSHIGIQALLSNLTVRLQEIDPVLWSHLRSLNIEPQYYALRWFMTLFAREFVLPDVCRLWDVIFACESDTLWSFATCFALAMLIEIRYEILNGDDFIDVLELLQDFPPIDIDRLIGLARRVETKDTKLLSALRQNMAPYAKRKDWRSRFISRVFRSSTSISQSRDIVDTSASVTGRPSMPPRRRRHCSHHDTYEDSDDVVSVRLRLEFGDQEDLTNIAPTIRVSITALPQW